MAYTFTAAASTVFGNQRVIHGVLTTDAVSGVVSFGLAKLFQAQATVQTNTTNNSGSATRFRVNALADGTASLGDLGVSGAVSGDKYLVTVYGV